MPQPLVRKCFMVSPVEHNDAETLSVGKEVINWSMADNVARLAWTMVAEGTTKWQIAQATAELSTNKHGNSDIVGFSFWRP